MTREETMELLKQIKVFYPRFDGVEKSGDGYAINPAVTDSWFKRIGYMSLERALKILDGYMSTENGSRTPTISLWMNNGRTAMQGGEITATLDRRNGVLVWKPESDKTFEKKISYNRQRGVWTTEDGYDYISIEELKEES